MSTATDPRSKKRHCFVLTLSQTVYVEFDASIMPDDDWRKHFYGSIKTPADLAEHLAYNYVANGIEKLSELDGFADKKDSQARFKDNGWDVEDSPEPSRWPEARKR